MRRLVALLAVGGLSFAGCGPKDKASPTQDVQRSADPPTTPQDRQAGSSAPPIQTSASASESAPAPAPATSTAPSTPPAAEASAPTAAPGPAPEAGSVRIAVVSSGLLRSEASVIAQVDKKLRSEHRGALTMGEASADEAAAARAYFAGSGDPALPEAWRAIETIVALEVLPPRGKEPRRVSSGLGSVVLLRAPAAAPIYLEQVSPTGGFLLRPDDLAPWLTSLIELAGEADEESR